jgi:DNA ligase-1
LEIRYIVRGLQGKLRIGLAQSTVLISLAHAFALTPPSFAVEHQPTQKTPEMATQYLNKTLTPEKRLEAAVAIVRKAYNEYPSYERLVEGCMAVPLELLHEECTLTPGVPVTPMLAKPTKSIQEVLKRLNGLRFTCEFKYDGERAQVHLLPGKAATKVFSRNLLDTSEKYPEVPVYVKEAMKESVDSFVMDAEVVAFNQETGKLVPFQILSTRKKTEESAATAKVQVIVEAFDLMYLNGVSLLDKTLAERRALLFEHFSPVEGKFKFAELLDHQENGDTIILEEFLDAAVKGQCEGLMVKTLDVNAVYEPSKRSLNWLKLKKDYLQGLGDSVDLVPLGAYHGRGKRTGVYGAYLLACFDPDNEEFQSVCKVGTGFSDEALKTLSESLNQHIIPQKSSQYSVSDQLECDVWFDAVQVWEVKAADMSKSSAHRGANGKTGEEGRGIGLRFPRFERIREDKKPEDATTSDQILEMYWAQDSVNKDDENDDDDDMGI